MNSFNQLRTVNFSMISTSVCFARNREFRAEGIFMLESVFCKICMNEIYGNKDGIIMTDSTCLLERNDITENALAGVICKGLSFLKIAKNVIAHKLVSGVLFRDEAIADCSYNKVSPPLYITLNRCSTTSTKCQQGGWLPKE